MLRAGDFAAVRLDNARAVVFGTASGVGRPYVAALSAVENEFAGANAVILGNTLVSRGNAPAVRVSVRECQFSDNRVDARQNGNVAVILSAPLVIMSSNRITGQELSVSLPIANRASTVVLGNITTRGFAIAGGGLQPPWNALNLQA